jgi:predicted small integral membrane protein
VGLFVAIVIAAHPAWTGIGLHEWLAVIIVLPALYHLVINWDWVVRWGTKLLDKLKAVSRINFVVDVALFLACVTVMVTGIMVLPGVVPTTEGTVVLGVWRGAHKFSSDATILLMLAHFLLHAEWMSDALARSFAPRPRRHAAGRARRSQPAPSREAR